MYQKLEMPLNQLNKLIMMLKLPQNLQPKPQLLPKLKDNNAQLTQQKPDLLFNKLKTIQVLLNGILKKLQPSYINLKQENKPLIELLPSPQLKVQEILMEPLLHSNHLEVGKKILLTLETSLFKLPKTLDHATAILIQDSLVQLKLLQLKLVWLLFQQVNKLLSVIVLKV